MLEGLYIIHNSETLIYHYITMKVRKMDSPQSFLSAPTCYVYYIQKFICFKQYQSCITNNLVYKRETKDTKAICKLVNRKQTDNAMEKSEKPSKEKQQYTKHNIKNLIVINTNPTENRKISQVPGRVSVFYSICGTRCVDHLSIETVISLKSLE